MNQEVGMKSFVVKNLIDIKLKIVVENVIIMYCIDKLNQLIDEGWFIVGEIMVLEIFMVQKKIQGMFIVDLV